MPMLFLDRHHFSADHSMFHSTYEVRMPVHSAQNANNPAELYAPKDDPKTAKNGMSRHVQRDVLRGKHEMRRNSAQGYL